MNRFMNAKEVARNVARKTSFPNLGKTLSSFALLIFCFCFAVETCRSQSPEAGEIAPPPLKILSKAEKAQLDETPDIKKRTILALSLMEARVKKAEALDEQNEFEQMYE